MYNEQLEQLIDAALADGVLTEKEKQILFKKAQAMGVDLDEFEMVLDARLVKLKKAEEEKAASSAPKSDKYGDVKKCPACGAIVQSYQGVCAECGYAFENIQANLSSQKLTDAIDALLKESHEKKQKLQEDMRKQNKSDEDIRHDRVRIESDYKDRIRNLIKNFPIPNSKADLIEFITSLNSKKSDRYYGSEYKIKFNECMAKAKLLFPNDSLVKSLTNEMDKQAEERKRKYKKRLIRNIVIGIIGTIIVLIIGVLLWSSGMKSIWKILITFIFGGVIIVPWAGVIDMEKDE